MKPPKGYELLKKRTLLKRSDLILWEGYGIKVSKAKFCRRIKGK